PSACSRRSLLHVGREHSKVVQVLWKTVGIRSTRGRTYVQAWRRAAVIEKQQLADRKQGHAPGPVVRLENQADSPGVRLPRQDAKRIGRLWRAGIVRFGAIIVAPAVCRNHAMVFQGNVLGATDTSGTGARAIGISVGVPLPFDLGTAVHAVVRKAPDAKQVLTPALVPLAG